MCAGRDQDSKGLGLGLGLGLSGLGLVLVSDSLVLITSLLKINRPDCIIWSLVYTDYIYGLTVTSQKMTYIPYYFALR